MTFTGFGDGATNPDNVAGGGVAESLIQTIDSAHRLGEGDFLEFGMNAAALALDGLSMWMDPLGSLATAGIGWLIEHLSFLREPLDWLAGNGDKIKAAVTTWNQVAADLQEIGEQQDRAVKGELPCWERGTAAEKFRQSQGELATEIAAVSKASTFVASEIAKAGTITAAIRGMIRDLIALFIWEVIRNAVIALASSWVSLGSSLAAFSAWAVGRGAAVLGKITQQLAKLVKLITRIMGRLKGLFGQLGDVLKRLGRFGKGGGTSAPHVPSTRGDGLADAGKRLEDWGNSRPKVTEAGDKLKQAGSEFKDGYGDAGNVWKHKYEEPYQNRVTQPSQPFQEAAGAYTPYKPATRPDGTVTPHSMPNVEDGGWIAKATADHLREWAKYDELEKQGKTFPRQQGSLNE
ncbi:hypothetical protein SAMN04488564_103675 [Lentzea waywayandensis]|uniref:PPE family protein n=1 Tax=Lentzea waywayandensis TaxID=84724 RepID=A0A1I6E231_9PSEU|nr:hypothetical protein [Lentzea waywayandensis]SFR11834.1 hypothetical protein SAMN04488564_103675 [Lentzea waywayandensis]